MSAQIGRSSSFSKWFRHAAIEPMERRMLLSSTPVDQSFETPALGSGSAAFAYNPSGSGWTFSIGTGPGAGIAAGSSGLGPFTAPDGKQAAFLQGSPATISQALTGMSAGKYTLTFYEAAGNGIGGDPFDVLIDSQVIVGKRTPASSTAFDKVTASFTVSTAGSHTLEFQGLGQGVFFTTLIDAVDMTITAVTNKGGTIGGTVFFDTNDNGKIDSGEKGIANVRMYIDVNQTGSYVSSDPSVLSTSTGAFTFPTLKAGTYLIREVIPTGYSIDTPIAGALDVTVTNSNVTGVLFGNITVTASISGTVFSDTNGNGTLDMGEKGIANVRVYIDTGKTGSYVSSDPSALTTSTGSYTLPNQKAGTYRLREVPPTGQVNTSMSTGYVDVTITNSNVAGVVFGNATTTASVSGTVFVDFNSDGKINNGDFGLGLWTVDLTYLAGINKGKIITATTTATGTYTFSGLTPGSYSLKIIPPVSNTTATKPTGNTLTLTLSSGEKSVGDNFGEI